MKISIVVGTRPEIIKMSPVIKECERLNLDFFILHTGQHYDYNMDGVFFNQLGLPTPRYNLGVGSGSYAEEVSKMLLGIEKVLVEENPSVLLVEGDTNSVIAGALSASKCGIPIGHLEAGLRSYFGGMSEEINRVVVDHVSNLLFAPTERAKNALLGEGITVERIYLTGNTVVDAVKRFTTIDYKMELPALVKRYMLATVHRRENVDNKERFASILVGLGMVAREFGMPIIYPIHPGAKKKLDEYGLRATASKDIHFAEPCDYIKFLWLEKYASLVLTDSGGVQEETSILGTPCVTLRDNTERPETVEVGANFLSGTSPDTILDCAKKMFGKSGGWENPFGDGKSAERIIDIIRMIYEK